ncbi:hypothetical protein F5882DRAFT_518670 [Hyaloscypha sp. PMI_1271]|nr:hypothetical protein F5882DRAFT_518670 [Hyaloscypha sp. PMI_1271]
MTYLRNFPMLDKIPWEPRQTPTTSSEPSTSNRTVPQTEGRVGDQPNSLDESKPSRSRPSSDASSESDDEDHLSAAHFDILRRDDVGEFNLKDGFSPIQNLPPPPNTTEPMPGKKYTAAFEMGNNRCMFRCEASVIGMDGVGEIPCISASTRFSSERFEIAMCGASFRGDLLDEYGVPLVRLYLAIMMDVWTDVLLVGQK